MRTSECLYWFKQACLSAAMIAYAKHSVKLIFASSSGLVNFCLELYREMTKFNYQGMLMRLFKRKII